MPTYVYQCKKCADNFEVFQTFTAKPLKKHDVCGGTLEKVLHASGIVFKGSGFYVTDSRKSSSKSATSASSSKQPSSPSSPASESSSASPAPNPPPPPSSD